MKKVIVVGANGFLGSRLSKALAARGYEVVSLVDSRFAYDMLVDTRGINIMEFRLENMEAIYDHPLIKNTDTLYNFAWSGVNALLRNNVGIQVENVKHSIHVMEFACHHGIQKVIVPGSASEVSCSKGIITGDEPPAPSDIYSATKVATRYLCQVYATQQGISLVWTLITSVYGTQRDDNNLLSYCIKSLLKGEKPSTTALEQEWDYIHVDDLMDALVLLGEKGLGGKVYPVGSGIHHPLKQCVEIIRDQINPDLPIGIGELPYKNPNKIDNQVMDISSLQQDTGFVPKWTFEDGIATVINDYKNRNL